MDDTFLCSTDGAFLYDDEINIEDEWRDFDLPEYSDVVINDKMRSKAELIEQWKRFKYPPINVDKIPEEGLHTTLMGCKMMISTSINIENIRPSLVLTDRIPIIECGLFIMMSMAVDYKEFRAKSKKSPLYRALYKSAKPYIDRGITKTYQIVYQPNNKKKRREGTISTYPGDLPYIVFAPTADSRFRKEMKSQIQFNIYDSNRKVYCVKRFINGSIQTPNCKDIVNFSDMYDVVDELIRYENTYYDRFTYRDPACQSGGDVEAHLNPDHPPCLCLLRQRAAYVESEPPTVILQNFRFVILKDWKINLELVYEEFIKKMKRDTEAALADPDYTVSADNIDICYVKHNMGDSKITVRFKAPKLKRATKYVTLSITNNGKCNIQGSLPTAPTQEIYMYLVNLFKQHVEWMYVPPPSDLELEMFEATMGS